MTEKPGLDGGERIADFVRDTRREDAERGRFFLAFDDGVALDEL